MEELRYAFGPYFLDRDSRVLMRDGDIVPLGHRCLALLETLLEADGKPVSKDELLERAWPGVIVEEVNLTVQIAALRKALGTGPDGLPWIATVPRVGYQLPRHAAHQAEAMQCRLPSIAVLPFENLSSDADPYFANGIVEGIITGLSRFRGLLVVSQAAVAESLSMAPPVRYLLKGSVQQRGKQIRVSARLIATEDGAHIWAERFDGEPECLFEFQDQIAERVAGLIAPEIRKTEIERACRKHARELDAFDLYLRALQHCYATRVDRIPEMLELAERAIALAPRFAPSLAVAALAYERNWLLSLEPMSAEDQQRCLDYAREALRAGEDDPLVVAIAGYLFLMVGHDPVAGLNLVNKACKANPNSAEALLFAAVSNTVAGDLDVAEACYRRAMELSPGSPENYQSIAGIGFTRFYREEYPTAVEWLLQSTEGGANDWPPAYWYLASAYGHLGQQENASRIVATLLRRAPNTSIASIAAFTSTDPSGRQMQLIEGLRKAGVPDV